MGRVQYAAKGLPGHVHPPGRFFLVQTLQVRQANGLKLVHRQPDMLQNCQRNAPGLVVRDPRKLGDPPALSRSGHIDDSTAMQCTSMVADVLAECKLALEIFSHELFGLGFRGAAQNLDVVLGEKLLGSLTHPAGDHQIDL
jgi:hypothetical protein